MTNTALRPFAVITSRRIDAGHPKWRTGDDMLAVGHFITCAHGKSSCARIHPDSRRIVTDGTLVDYMAANEFFDGEAVYEPPIVCECAR